MITFNIEKTEQPLILKKKPFNNYFKLIGREIFFDLYLTKDLTKINEDDK